MREPKNISVIVEESHEETKVPFIFQSVVELVLGIFMIIYRSSTTNTLFIAIGALMICYGVFDLIAFITNNRPYSFRRGLSSGVLITIIGVAFIVQAQQLQNLVSIIIGALIVIESIVNCRRAFIIRNLGWQKWYLIMIISIVALVLGVIICIYPNLFGTVISLVMGITMIFEAVIDICSIFGIMFLRGNVKKDDHSNKTNEPTVITLEKK